MALIRQHVGKAVVRVGVTQYPAGLGVTNASELKLDLVDACANVRMGTKLFGKVYRIVTKWYGNPVHEAFDDATLAPAAEEDDDRRDAAATEPSVQARTESEDPNKAGIRIDLSGIGRGR